MTIYHVIGFIIGVITAQIILYYMKNKPKEKEEGYNGESEDFFQFNKKIVIRREDGSPYLYRRTLIGIGQWFSIKLHKVVLSDGVCPHDHPWGFLTVLWKNGYYEWTPKDQKESGKILEERVGVDGIIEVKRWHKEGSVMYRPAKWRHSLELEQPVSNEDSIPAYSFVITGKVIREWGFFTKSGWIFWEKYDQKKHC